MNTHTHSTVIHYIPFLLSLPAALPLSFKHKFALMCSLYSIFSLYSLFSATQSLFLSHTGAQRYTQRNTRIKKENPHKQKHISEKMMMEQLCENSLAGPSPAYQVTAWRHKFQPCYQAQSLLSSAELKVTFCSSGGNTNAHTWPLFIFNRC